MGRYKVSLRILTLAVLVSAATLAWSQESLVVGSFNLPMEARWGQLTLAPGNYSFVVPDNPAWSSSMLEIRQDGRIIGYTLATSRNNAEFEDSSMTLDNSGGGYAVTEVRIGRVGAFSYALPKEHVSSLAQAKAKITLPAQVAGN